MRLRNEQKVNKPEENSFKKGININKSTEEKKPEFTRKPKEEDNSFITRNTANVRKVEESKDEKPEEEKPKGPPTFRSSKPAAKKPDEKPADGGWGKSNTNAKGGSSKPAQPSSGGFSKGGFTSKR